MSYTEIECIPNPACRCCVCQGIHCFVWHEGHYHDSAILPCKVTATYRWAVDGQRLNGVVTGIGDNDE